VLLAFLCLRLREGVEGGSAEAERGVVLECAWLESLSPFEQKLEKREYFIAGAGDGGRGGHLQPLLQLLVQRHSRIRLHTRHSNALQQLLLLSPSVRRNADSPRLRKNSAEMVALCEA
jgi:hypothetical protein